MDFSLFRVVEIVEVVVWLADWLALPFRCAHWIVVVVDSLMA
jgi:hypothetical protein